MRPVRDEMGGGRQSFGGISENRQSIPRPGFHFLKTCAGGIGADQRNERCLAGILILRNRLADKRSIAFDIEQIIGELKSNPERASVIKQSVALRLGRLPKNRARFASKTNQRAGFHGLQPQNDRLGQTLARRLTVKHLPARHASPARMACQTEHERTSDSRVRMGRGMGEDFEGQCQQGIAGQDRGGLVKGLMNGRTSAPQIVIIHRRQVVMDERVTMHAFKRYRRVQRRFICDAAKSGTFQNEERPEPFAAAHRRIAHRFHQPFRNVLRARRLRQPIIEPLLDLGCAAPKTPFKGFNVG